MGVLAFGQELAAQALDERVVCRLSGPGEDTLHSVRIGPKVQVTGNELGTLIDPDGFGMPVTGADALENADDMRTGEPLAWFNGYNIRV